MKILVPGGAGFIGSHLVDHLLLEGHELLIVDTAAAGTRNLEQHAGDTRLRVLAHDVSLPLPAAIRRFRPQRIYNLACSASPAQASHDPVHATMTAVVGTRQLLELARDCDARFLFASSGGVYGDPAVHPQPESYLGNVNANGPRAAHDEAKRCAETLCCAYHDRHGVQTRIARIFSTYGPRMNAAHGQLISKLVTQALKGEDLTINGDGTQSRSYCHVDDMVRGLMQLMESDIDLPVNIGSAEEHTTLQVAERVLRMTGSQSRLRHVAPRPDDAHRRRPDIALAERSIGWRPRVPLQQGLLSTVDFFRAEQAAATPTPTPTSTTTTTTTTTTVHS